jgi:hypothetical protein
LLFQWRQDSLVLLAKEKAKICVIRIDNMTAWLSLNLSSILAFEGLWAGRHYNLCTPLSWPFIPAALQSKLLIHLKRNRMRGILYLNDLGCFVFCILGKCFRYGSWCKNQPSGWESGRKISNVLLCF